MAKILVIRLSAIGDVAMTIPVIYSAARANPADQFTVLTQAFLVPLFINRPSNVNLLSINTKAGEKSLCGLLKFTFALSRNHFDRVIDLHNVIRSVIIRTAFKLQGKSVNVLDKARKARKQLTTAEHKVLQPLRPVVDRYADVFREAGLVYSDTFTSLFDGLPVDLGPLGLKDTPKRGKWIGIAPFAKHQGKIYPIDAMEEVVASLSSTNNYTIFLFGGKGNEEKILSSWEERYPHVMNVVGKYSLDKELALISHLDILLSMDSANMHFASLVGTRVLSIWGATHPFTGFYGYHQDIKDAIQVDLPCRPCSIFGQKPCARGDWACMKQISPQIIIGKIINALEEDKSV